MKILLITLISLASLTALAEREFYTHDVPTLEGKYHISMSSNPQAVCEKLSGSNAKYVADSLVKVDTPIHFIDTTYWVFGPNRGFRDLDLFPRFFRRTNNKIYMNVVVVNAKKEIVKIIPETRKVIGLITCERDKPQKIPAIKPSNLDHCLLIHSYFSDSYSTKESMELCRERIKLVDYKENYTKMLKCLDRHVKPNGYSGKEAADLCFERYSEF